MPGSESDFGANNLRSRPDFDTFIKKKRQQYNFRKQRGRFPRNRGFSRGCSSRNPEAGPFNKGTRFPFKARSPSPTKKKFYSRRPRFQSSSKSKYNSRYSRSQISPDKGTFLTNSFDNGNTFSTSRIDSDSSFEERKSLNKLGHSQIEGSCSPRESLRITIDNDRCESVNSPKLQTDYKMNYQQWRNNKWRNKDSSRRSGSGSNYSNSPDNRSRNNHKEESPKNVFSQKHLSERDMHNYDDDVHSTAIASKATSKSQFQTNLALEKSVFTQKHLSERDMHNYDDDVHSTAIASKKTGKQPSITGLTSSSLSSSSYNRNENKRQNDDSSSGYRKRHSESKEYKNGESFAATSSSSCHSQSSNRIFEITESSNYNTLPFTAPIHDAPLFHCVEVKPSRLKGTLKIGIDPPKKVKLENAPLMIPGLDLESDDVDEYLYGGGNSNDSQSKSPAPDTSTNAIVETTTPRVSVLDPRLRRNSTAVAQSSDIQQLPILPTQETGLASYSAYAAQGSSSLYYANSVQASNSPMAIQLPVPDFIGITKTRQTNSFNANNLKQISIATPSEILASQNNRKINEGGNQSTINSNNEAKIRLPVDKENAEYLIKVNSDKLIKYKNKLQELKNEQLELIKQNQKRKDGFIDPKYTANCELQNNVNNIIQEIESKIESHRKRINEYDKEKKLQRVQKPVLSENVRNSSTNKMYASRNESSIEKSKSSQVAFQYVDYRNHFCTHCHEIIPSVEEFLSHLHSTHIDVVNNIRESDRPWTIKSKDNKIQKADKVLPAAIKGVEFMLPITGFYCKLCKELCADNASAKVHLESYAHNKSHAKFCQENINYENKMNLQRNAKLNADRRRGSSSEIPIDTPNSSKKSEVKHVTSSKSSAKNNSKEVLVTNNVSENLLVADEGSHTITKPGAKIPIKLKDKGVSNNVILAEAATKADELKAVKQAESEALATSSTKYSFKPMQFKKPLSRGPPPPLEEFITIGSSAPLCEELASPPPLKLQPNIKPNLPVKIKPEPRDTGYDKYMHSNVGTQDKNEIVDMVPIKCPLSPPDNDQIRIDQTEGSYCVNEPLSSHNNESDSINLDTENIKSEREEDNGLNLKIVSVQSLNTENGAQNYFQTKESADPPENSNPKQSNEDDDWDSDRETLPDEDRIDLLDEDLCYHENDQALSLATHEGRMKIENCTSDDAENLWL